MLLHFLKKFNILSLTMNANTGFMFHFSFREKEREGTGWFMDEPVPSISREGGRVRGREGEPRLILRLRSLICNPHV